MERKKSIASFFVSALLFGLTLFAFGVGGRGPLFGESLKSSREGVVYNSLLAQLSPRGEYTALCAMATYLPGRQEAIVKSYHIFSKGTKTLLVTRSPAREKGNMILMSERSLWQYFAQAGKTVNMNAAASLSAGVNITDILSASVFSFYQKEGVLFEGDTGVVIFKAIDKSAPYGEIRYRVGNKKVERVEAYARSGLLMKNIYFVEYTAGAGGVYPSKIKIENALREGEYTLIQISDIRELEIPDYYFNPATLDKVRE